MIETKGLEVAYQKRPSPQRARKQQVDLIKLLVKRDLRVRYRGSVLGYLWSMLNPLLYMSILTLVFSHVVRMKSETYAIFILSGIMSWNLLQQSISIGVGSIVGSGHLLRKVQLPAILFPTASICGVLVNFALSFIPFLVISAVLRSTPPPTIFLLPFLLIPYLLFIWGTVVCLATLNVKYRDIGHAMEPIMQVIFYATPVVYSSDIIPEKWRFVMDWNPVARYIEAFRAVMLRGEIPSLLNMGILCAFAAVMCVVGLFCYRKLHAFFVYHL